MIERIDDVEDDLGIIRAHEYQAVIDISDYSYMPEVGWSYENGKLFLKLAPVTARQIRRGLLALGITGVMIETALNSLPEPTKSAALIEWEYSNEFFRTHELVAMVAQMLGWTAKDLDDLWKLSRSL